MAKLTNDLLHNEVFAVAGGFGDADLPDGPDRNIVERPHIADDGAGVAGLLLALRRAISPRTLAGPGVFLHRRFFRPLERRLDNLAAVSPERAQRTATVDGMGRLLRLRVYEPRRRDAQ